MKRKISLFLAIVTLITVLSTFNIVSALQVASGECGENLTWTLDNVGTLTISGTGEMTNYTSSTVAPWHNYKNSLKKIVIDNDVTSIGNYAFYFCGSFTTVSLGSNVANIGDYAFTACIDLVEITIPDSVLSIGRHAFSSCISLRKVILSNSVTTIGTAAFHDCEVLGSVNIPCSVTNIGSYAFGGVFNAPYINVNENNLYYSSENGTLFNKDKTILILHPFSTFIESYAIPDGVVSIDVGAFASCENLISITIPNSVTNIRNGAFTSCCYRITDVYYTGTREEWNKILVGSNNDYLLNATIHFSQPKPSPTKTPSSNNKIKNFFLSGFEGEAELIGENAYIAYASDNYAKHVIGAYRDNSYATVTSAVLNSPDEAATADFSGKWAVAFDRMSGGEKKYVAFKVVAENGTEAIYTVTLYNPPKTVAKATGFFLSGFDLPTFKHTTDVQEIRVLNYKKRIMQAQVPGHYNATVEFRYGNSDNFDKSEVLDSTYAKNCIRLEKAKNTPKVGSYIFARIYAENGAEAITYKFKVVKSFSQ